jgi:hypothetical protein
MITSEKKPGSELSRLFDSSMRLSSLVHQSIAVNHTVKDDVYVE